MHTVRQLADVAGITPRTLHHYDAIGLLKPSLVGANGYRYYNEEALLRLQQILLYRELGLDLDAIKRLMGKKDFSVMKALEAHRSALARRIQRLETLVETVGKTIASLQGGTAMNDEQLFAGLTAQEKEYAEEALERWDPAIVRESHRRYGQLSPAQKAAMKAAGEALNRDWAALIGTDPAGPAARAVVERWRQGIAFFYEPTPEILVGLSRHYLDDPRFKATYDKVDPRLAEYVAQCVEAVYAKT
jgi:DNA-binding transcriptional MerR regulator